MPSLQAGASSTKTKQNPPKIHTDTHTCSHTAGLHQHVHGEFKVVILEILLFLVWECVQCQAVIRGVFLSRGQHLSDHELSDYRTFSFNTPHPPKKHSTVPGYFSQERPGEPGTPRLCCRLVSVVSCCTTTRKQTSSSLVRIEAHAEELLVSAATRVDSCGLSWPPVDSRGLPWAPVDSRGLLWAPVDSRGLPWTPMGECSPRPPKGSTLVNVFWASSLVRF